MTKNVTPQAPKPAPIPYALFGDVFVFATEKDKTTWMAAHSSRQTREENETPELAVYDKEIHTGNLTCPCCRKASLKPYKGGFITKKESHHTRGCDYAKPSTPLTLFGQNFIFYTPRYAPDCLAKQFNQKFIRIGEGAPEPWLGSLKKTPTNYSTWNTGKDLIDEIGLAQKAGNLQTTWIFNGKAIRADKMILDLTDKASDFQKNNLTDLFNALKAGDSYPVIIHAQVPVENAQNESKFNGKDVPTFPTLTSNIKTTIQFLDPESVKNLRSTNCKEFRAVAYPVLSDDGKSISFVVAATKDMCQIPLTDARPA